MWRPRRRFLGLKGLRVLGAPWLVGGVNDLCAAYVDARLKAVRTALAYRGGSERLKVHFSRWRRCSKPWQLCKT